MRLFRPYLQTLSILGAYIRTNSSAHGQPEKDLHRPLSAAKVWQPSMNMSIYERTFVMFLRGVVVELF